MTDNQKLYSFFSMWITVCIVILCVFDPALWIKAILGLNILGCLWPNMEYINQLSPIICRKAILPKL